MVSNLAEPRNILAEPLGSAEPTLGITDVETCKQRFENWSFRSHKLNDNITSDHIKWLPL
jgi:hypothetical protein